MAEIHTTSTAPLDPNSTIGLPSMEIPSFRTCLAVQQGTVNNILIHTTGGLGDLICAEPSLRYALRNFTHCDISLATEVPELFTHLTFKKVYHLPKEVPPWEKYYVFKSYFDPGELGGEFICHVVTQIVDYISLCLWRCQIPVDQKQVTLQPSPQEFGMVQDFLDVDSDVLIHAGNTWPSRTLPAEYWDEITASLFQKGLRPVLIGSVAGDKGTVKVNPKNCLDVRGKLSIMQSVAAVKTARVLLTNDSAPLHMAVSGKAWVGFFSTVKHPDYIKHWRWSEWAPNMSNLALGGLYETMNVCPNNPEEIKMDQVDPKLLLSWLPDPERVANWAREKM